MVEEATLEDVGSGVAPVGPGWFVVNARDAAWLTNDAFGARVVFEGGMPVIRRRPDLPAIRFAQLGITLQVLQPGQPSGLYHAESNQEDFLVLVGECLLLVEGEERPLHAWDFVHCPPGTAHVFVGAGNDPCVLLLTGARTPEREIVYPSSDLARRHGAGVDAETRSARDAYASHPHWQPERPDSTGMPWA
ncbi:MAG TPA: cupin domain-containing protein [Gaiellaceae bacterium]|nr:cupin domain-containing protein [Gaiellaceae bacterium]